MKTYIVLLRGINVSGQKKIKMADLRSLLGKEKRFTNLQTYIQSGNIVLDSKLKESQISARVQEMIKSQYGFDVPIQVRSIQAWQSIVENNMFLLRDPQIDIKLLYITLLAEVPDSENQMEFLELDFSPDRFHLDSQTVYLAYDTRVSDSKLSNNLIERKLKVSCTSRNWRTTLKLLEMAQSSGNQ